MVSFAHAGLSTEPNHLSSGLCIPLRRCRAFVEHRAIPYVKEIREVQKKKANRFIFLSYSLASKKQGTSLSSGQGDLPNYHVIKSPAGSILYFSDQMGITAFPYYLVVDDHNIVVAWGEDFSVLLKTLSSLP